MFNHFPQGLRDKDSTTDCSGGFLDWMEIAIKLWGCGFQMNVYSMYVGISTKEVFDTFLKCL